MGMNIYGREPSNEEGSCFHASTWSWAALYLAMGQTSHDLLGAELLKAMAFKEAAGPADQAVCTQIAGRLEQALDSDRSVFVVAPDLVVDRSWRFLTPYEASKLGPDQTKSLFHVEREYVRDWIAFLRHCGGFRVF